jgi:hypothetical protein
VKKKVLTDGDRGCSFGKGGGGEGVVGLDVIVVEWQLHRLDL